METDDASGMAHTLWRKQDNFSGRWTSPDPYGGSMTIADPQSFNRYTYVNNDPVNLVDPSGLYPNDYHGADSGWQDVNGYFWGTAGPLYGGRGFGGAHIRNGTARHDSMVNQAMALRDWKHAYLNLDDDGARAIMDANPSIGYFEERAASSASNDSQSASVDVIGGLPIGGANTFQAPSLSFVTLWNNHAGMERLESDQSHQCSMKLFSALVKSDFDVSSFNGYKEDGLAARAYEVGNWLVKALGRPIIIKGGQNDSFQKFKSNVTQYRGIILLKHFWGSDQGHLDLYRWNLYYGPQMKGGSFDYIRRTLNAKAGDIWFWPIPH